MLELGKGDPSFQIEKIWETPLPLLTLDHLHVPQNLHNKTILELFSGKEQESMKKVIEARGGTHITLDRFQRIRKGKHVVTDAFRDLPFRENAFDYVLMAHPPMYNTNETVSVEMVTGS